VGTAIGDKVLDLAAVAQLGHFSTLAEWNGHDPVHVFSQSSLNAFMSLGRPVWRSTRHQIQSLLAEGSPLSNHPKVLFDQTEVIMHLPAEIGDYTDFYASREHATNVGIMFRGKENALMPNWLHLPVGYHGRASSIVVSGTDLTRPCGQRALVKGEAPTYGPSVRLDYELEMAALIGVGNPLGTRISVDQADEHIFGLVVMNDWSARDIQAWEYVPLGPFLGKNFGTTLSPWVVTLDALEPFLVDQPAQDPTPLAYLQDKEKSGYNIHLEASLTPKEGMRTVLTKSNLKYMYWTFKQQLAHHSVGGCNMRTGDLIGSGTISGPTEDSFGSMLELCWAGQKEIPLNGGKVRKFIQDEDVVELTGWCQGDGYRVGFGNCTGRILPAKP
jgi:fumarylacetoacetase